jgi:hypothetical protein
MKQLQIWFAKSPLASFLKVFVAGILGWVVLNVGTLNLHPAIAIAGVSSLPILISWLNPADDRFGKGSGK